MLIRVRSNVGVWRVEVSDNNNNDDAGGGLAATVRDVEKAIAVTRPHVVYRQPLSMDPACAQPVDPSRPLVQQGIMHGSMVYCLVDPETCLDVSIAAAAATTTTTTTTTTSHDNNNKPASSSSSSDTESSRTGQQSRHHHQRKQQQQQQGGGIKSMRRVIDKDGRILLVPNSSEAAASSSSRSGGPDRGFRKGLLPLRDMKMSWTLNDFIALDSQYEFKIQRQESAVCKQVSLEVNAIQEFQAYLAKFQFQRKRFGYLYGRFVAAAAADAADNFNGGGNAASDGDKLTKVRVEAIYEPPQEFDPETAEGFVPLDDPKESVVEQIAEMLGLRRVGWIFGGHESRDPGFVLSGAEILMAAEFQLEAAGGVDETPFVTVKVAPRPQDKTVSVEAFQVSRQCMAMVAEQALELSADPKVLKVNETFTAIQEGKESPTVENNFFLCVVPIVQHTSAALVCDFPRLNRDVDDRFPSFDEMRRQLQKSGSSGWTFEDRLADFNLLLFLSDHLDVKADFPKICAAIVNKHPLEDGYKLILKSLAGMEGSY